jgi:uncharacterized protein YcbX
MLEVTIWDDTCRTIGEVHIDEWFTSEKLNCLPVWFTCLMIACAKRTRDIPAMEGSITSFSDAYPMLIIGQASLDDLNTRLPDALPMNRFRPNIVFTGGEALQRGYHETHQCNGIDMYGVKLCARCVMTTVDQE